MRRRYWHKQDWRKVRLNRHPNHLCIRWYHWSWRPRIVFCYWDARMSEQRAQAVKWGKI